MKGLTAKEAALISVILVSMLLAFTIYRLICLFNAKTEPKSCSTPLRLRGGGKYSNGRICEECKKTYKNKSSFANHPCKKKQSARSIDKRDYFKCNNCNSVFEQKKFLRTHIVNKVCSSTAKMNRKCPECDAHFYRVTSLYKHLFVNHQADCEFEERTFFDFAEFEKWKETEDAYNFINAYNRPGEKMHKDTTYFYYVCNFQRVPELNRRTMPETSQDSKKKGCRTFGTTPALECPARISVKKTKEGLSVKYFKTHNHPCNFGNTKYVHYPITVRNTIKEKLQQGVEIKRIRKDLIGNFGDLDMRDEDVIDQKQFYVKRKYIKDIQRSMINKTRPLSDAQSVYEKVRHLSQKNFNPIILYKPKGCLTAVGGRYLDYDDDLFVLGIQTREQLKIFEEGCRRIVCIDDTHQTTQYSFHLLNIVVPDELRKGYPVAHFITTRLDKIILKGLFKALQDRFAAAGVNIQVNAVMTDDDRMTGPAFQEVFGSNVNHLLCTWHLKTSWESNLGKIGDGKKTKEEIKEIRIRVKSYLNAMQSEFSKEKLKCIMEDFYKTMTAQRPDFVTYFKTYYDGRQSLWSMAYRNFEHAGTDTNNYCESFHNKLKTQYFERHPNRRVDDLLDVLLDVEKDIYLDWRDRTSKTTHFLLPRLDLDKKHERGMTIPDEDIFIDEQKDNVFFIRSQTDSTRLYKVIKNTDKCNNCKPGLTTFTMKCQSCGDLCGHLYHCECRDSHYLCKHIHKIHSATKRQFIEETIISNWNEEGELRGVDSPKKWELTTMPQKNILHNKGHLAGTQTFENVDKFERALKTLESIKTKIKQKTSRASIPDKFFSDLENLHALLDIDSPSPHLPKITPNTDSDKLSPASKLRKQLPRFQRATKSRRRVITDDDNKQDEEGKIRQATEEIRSNCERMYYENCEREENGNGTEIQSTNYVPGATFTPPLDDLQDCSILVNGIRLTAYDIKSIDAHVPRYELDIIKKLDRRYENGWLTDKAIDAYLNIIARETPGFAAVSALSSELMKHNLPPELPANWKNKLKLLIPANPTGLHWVLFIYEPATNIYFFLNSSPDSSGMAGSYKDFIVDFHRFAFNSPEKSPVQNIAFPPCVKQSDEVSCGVFVCYYTFQLSKGKNLTDPFNPERFRLQIYNKIIEHCDIV